MDTATDTVQQVHRAPPETPQAQDPERDINAKTTVTWALSWAVILFVGLWLLLVVFDRVVFEERSKKIETRPNLELQQMKGSEELFLSGKWEEGFPRKSIDQVMKEMAGNK